MHQLNPQDAQFLYMESENNFTHVTGVHVFDPSTAPGGKVRFKDIIAHVESRLHTSPIFRRRLVRVPFDLDFPYWVDDEYFDIEYHIRHGRLPEPGDWRQFCIHVARYHSRPLALQRPPWEMYVIEGLDRIPGFPAGAYAIATKLHHTAVDGASVIRFYAAMSDIDPQGTPALAVPEREIEPAVEPSVPEMVGRALKNNVREPLQLANTVVRSVPALANLAQKALQRDEGTRRRVPFTRFNVPVGPHKMFDAAIFPLADFKEVRRAVENATINDVVLAVCAGGLRRYLEHHNELPEDPLVAWVPINARPGKGTHVDVEASGNRITAMTASLHTHVADPLARLEAITAGTRQSKEAKAGISARLMTDISRHIPAATQALAGRLVLRAGASQRVCNLFISNVPGPQQPLYMAGALNVHSFGMAPLADGMGLFIGTPSYNGEITFNVTSTRHILPDIDFFADCLRASLEELKAAVGAGPASGRTGTTPAAGKKKTARKKTGKTKRKRRSKKAKKKTA